MENFKVYKFQCEAETKRPLIAFHHGAGYCGKSFYLIAERLKEKLACDIIYYDCRGHGKTITEDDSDLSLSTLASDMESVISIHGGNANQIILVGHSMGGAVVVELARRRVIPNILGVVVLDVVEGSAIQALGFMRKILTARPTHFTSVEEAVDWAYFILSRIETQQLRNIESAKISVPDQLLFDNGIYKWRTNLLSSEKYWNGWFENMSQKFLSNRGAKLLVLAGADRLDKELTIGQMQGKFQLELFPEAGHAIHEDIPDKIAELLVSFWSRNQPLDISKIRKIPI